jgi:hypothetical protein
MKETNQRKGAGRTVHPEKKALCTVLVHCKVPRSIVHLFLEVCQYTRTKRQDRIFGLGHFSTNEIPRT